MRDAEKEETDSIKENRDEGEIKRGKDDREDTEKGRKGERRSERGGREGRRGRVSHREFDGAHFHISHYSLG